MNSRVLFLACGVAFASLLYVACGGGGGMMNTCNPMNCEGCCDTSGTCQAGTTVQACGVSGAQCSVCTGTGTCTAHACSTGGGTGTGGGTATGGGSATGGGTGTGGGSATGGGTGTGGGSATTYTMTTVTNAWTNMSTLNRTAIEIDNAVVVAASTPFMSTGTCVGTAMVETFYIQDSTGGAGIGVYHSCKDTGDLPNVGDVVTVKGRLNLFDGSLQISAYAGSGNFPAIAEAITITAVDAGRSTGGAFPPAGMPVVIMAANQPEYNHDAGSDPHPEMRGQVIHFDNVVVTNPAPPLFIKTASGMTSGPPEGFEISNGIWVDDSQVYFNCIKNLDGGVGTLTFPNGITGVWDRYQDFYAGTSQNPAPIVPVLLPLNCPDVGQ